LHRVIAHKGSLSSLREVWIMNIPVSYSKRWIDTISSVLASLPALETVTVVLDHSEFPPARPNLRILPRLSALSFESTHLKTVRLVHGFCNSPDSHSAPVTTGASTRLSLEKILLQLSSREYDYLDTLIVQTTPHFYVDGEELAEIAEHIPNVRHETIDVLPSMDLPNYCFEPASSKKASFAGSMW
ncbi:hypothetical protein L226DRAFT_432672, partial [Lentinus tigrinus ALCF2SS1-7]